MRIFIADHAQQQGEPYSLREITLACEQLEKRSIVVIERREFVSPTSLGEALIAVLVGHEALPLAVPPLPEFPRSMG